ncbi:MAG: hypothetical protein KDK23_16840, partial [Leptospiraceae bacterium]|nr:hypothetical protein [Leptospiraceae bacterium]
MKIGDFASTLAPGQALRNPGLSSDGTGPGYARAHRGSNVLSNYFLLKNFIIFRSRAPTSSI